MQPIGLGGMPLSIEGRPDERTARAVIEAFVAGGGNFIDTAISYCLDNDDLGHNERLIAATLAALGRTDVIVATKGGLTRPSGRWDVDCTPTWLRRCCEQSARDLGAPIALYYLHAVDPNVPLAESLGELVKLRDEGKIAAIGLSNVDGPAPRRSAGTDTDRGRAEPLQRARDGATSIAASLPAAASSASPMFPIHRSAATGATAGCASIPTLARIARSIARRPTRSRSPGCLRTART